MSLRIQVASNTISPGIAKAAKALTDKRPVLEAMGTQLVSLTKRAFNDSALRAAPWPPKKDGSVSRLKKTGALYQSITITRLTQREVHVASDRPYAAAHQLGSPKKNLPPRPFFPFLSGRMIPSAAAKIEATAKRKIAALLPK
jgi:phage gpG-like protein